MQVYVPRENAPENRVAVTPETVRKLIALGLQVQIERDAGESSRYPDAEYEAAGVDIATDPVEALRSADVVLRVRKPALAEVMEMKSGAIQASFLDPFNESELLEAIAARGIVSVSLEMMPRTTLAQKMDALSSQANLAGYQAVIIGASRLGRLLPMMMTPAGTISPARVFVIGVGVAGLQAIATAKRLGARVEAFDTRPEVEEQVRSLGAKFVKIDLGETGSAAQGYAKELTPEQIERQKQGMAKVCAQSDIVITTAKLFGRKAPRIVTGEMVAGMRPGSVVVDLAAEGGGNVEGTILDEEVTTAEGVTIVGYAALERQVPFHASQMFASNLYSFIEHFWDKEEKTLHLPEEDEIARGSVLTRNGRIVNERYLSIVKKS